MTIRTLDRSLDVDRFDETDPRAFEDCRIKDAATRRRCINASDAKCVIFRPVCDSHVVTELLASAEHTKAVWMYRRYADVANSAVERWGDTTQRYIEDVLAGGGDWGEQQWNREAVTEDTLETLRRVVRADTLTPHAAAVLFWYMRNKTFFEQELERNPSVVLCQYEPLVTNPGAELERLCGFLGIRFESDMGEKVFSSSIEKHTVPRIDPRITDLADGLFERLQSVRSLGQ